jgi:hypothetical protein
MEPATGSRSLKPPRAEIDASKKLNSAKARDSRVSDGVLADDGNVGTGADPVYRLEKL